MAASSLPPEILMEERQDELMISPTGGNPTQRSAHFLNPTLPLQPFPCSVSSKLITISDSKKTHFKSLFFKAHRHPTEKWKAWVDRLHPMYQEIWKQAGIYHSVLSSTQKIPKDRNLILGLAERWCVDSNTFIFPWGETTLTLEDMAVLGGYSILGDSVLGDSVLFPPKTAEAIEILSSLEKAKKEICGTTCVSHQAAWMDYFMDTGNKLEHQAFLIFWLSRFVLTKSHYTITRDLFPVAIHLSYGNPIALAPAVLASIYRDLRLLKKLIVDLSKLGDNECADKGSDTPFSSPFQLVLLWAWKRFSGDPRLGKRNGGREWDVDNVRKALDSAAECFLWRPYALASGNFMFSKLYKDNGEWVLVGSHISKELVSYARSLRVSELVGLDCIEQYLPNRVAMQFGFDQDIPGYFTRSNGSYVDAWRNYTRPISNVKLYVPPRLFEADVTLRYLKWYKGSSSTAMEDSFKGVKITKKKRSFNHRTVPRGPLGGQRDAPLLAPPVSLATCDREEGGDAIANLKEAPVNSVELSNSNRDTDSLSVSANLLSGRPHDPEKQASDDVCTLSRAEASTHDTLKDHDALAVLSVENSDKENCGGNLICSKMLILGTQDDNNTAEKVKVPHPEFSDVAQLEYGNHKDPLVELPKEPQPSLAMNLHATPMNLPLACELVHVPEVVLQTGVIMEISPSETETIFPWTPRFPNENIFATRIEGANSVRSSNFDETIALTSPNSSSKKPSSEGKSVEQAEGVLTKQGETAPCEKGVEFEPIEREIEGVEKSNEKISVACNAVRKEPEGNNRCFLKDKMPIAEQVGCKRKSSTLVSIINDEDKGSWDGTTFKLPELEIDVRLSRLERIVAALKAAKREGKFRKMSR